MKMWIVIAVVCVVGSSCKKGGTDGTKGATESKITGRPSDAPIAIAPNWKPGQRYVMRMESAQTMQMPNFLGGRGGQPGAKTMSMENDFAQEYALAVTNAADGNRGMELEILAIELQVAQGDQQQISYDSRNKVARDGGPMTDVFDRVIGGKVYYLVSPENKVLKVDGVKELFDRVEATANDGAPDPAANAPPGGRGRGAARGGAALLRGIYNEEVFKQLIELSSQPPNAIHVGESWTVNRDMTQPMIGGMRLAMTNTFRGWQEHDGKKCVRVEFTGSITATGEGGTGGGMPFRMALQDGVINGRYWLATEVGVPVETSVDQNYALSFAGMPQPGGTGPAGNDNAQASFSAPVRQHVSIKLLEIKTLSQ